MRRTLTLCLLPAFAFGCEEALSPEWTLEITASTHELAADGVGGGTNITIGVFDANNGNNPAPEGEVVQIQCNNSSGERTGAFIGSDDPGEATSFTDNVGLSLFRFSCNGDTGSTYDVNCFAIAMGASAPLVPPLQCVTRGEQ